ncbi:MAG: GNAT family N-acetyltransferase [Rhodobacteraceae bacterium]|nr:GNAT family N-acetyltransferase [Paracoccaceae bacterium]
MTVTLRAAYPTDAGTTGEILYRFMMDTEWMPKLYTAAETIGFCGTMIERGWVTVAEMDHQVLGFLARDGEEICALYVARGAHKTGIGKQLLDHAKEGSDRLMLWAFQHNVGAQRFYRREGFVPIETSDGSRNEEGLPDIAFEWVRQKSGKPAATGPNEAVKEAAGKSKDAPTGKVDKDTIEKDTTKKDET